MFSIKIKITSRRIKTHNKIDENVTLLYKYTRITCQIDSDNYLRGHEGNSSSESSCFIPLKIPSLHPSEVS